MGSDWWNDFRLMKSFHIDFTLWNTSLLKSTTSSHATLFEINVIKSRNTRINESIWKLFQKYCDFMKTFIYIKSCLVFLCIVPAYGKRVDSICRRKRKVDKYVKI